MSNVRANNGKLFFDFRYHGVRCREYTKLTDTPSNRKRMQKVLDKIEAEITLGSFDYGKYFPGSKLAEQFAQRADAACPQPTVAEPQTTPLYKVFATTWFHESEPLWRRSHLATIRSTLYKHLLPAFGEQPVGSITKADCLAFRAQLAKLNGRNGNAQLAPKTVNRIMQVHHQIMVEAAERYDVTSPTEHIKRLKQPRVDIQPFSLDEVQQLIAHVRADFRDYLIVRLFTGLRTGELHGLQWKYIDFERRQLLIRETWVRGKLEYTKTDGSQREVQMSRLVYDALKRQEAASRAHSNFVFCSREGEPLDLNNVTNRIWYPLLRHLGLEKRRPYQSRHTAATLWLAAGENPEWVARQLGHSNTEMLFKTYSRFIPNLTRTDGSAMDQLLTTHIAANTPAVRHAM